MALMESIRRGTDSTAVRLMFGAIALVFVFFGINPTGNMGSMVAKVNGASITDTEYQRAMGNITRGNADMDEDEIKELGRQVIDELIAQRVQVQEAERVGLVVSLEEIAREVRKSGAFQTEDGKFNKKLYAEVLRHSGLSQGRYEEQLREMMLITKLRQLAMGSVQVSDAEVRRAFDSAMTQVSVQWVRIDDEAMLSHVTLDDAEVAAWLETHPTELKEAYDREFNTRWSRPRRLDVSTILLRTDLDQGRMPEEDLRSRLEAVATQARGGADFAALALRFSEDLATVDKGGRMGFQTEVQLGTDLGEAAMAAGVGGVSAVVRTARGLQIVYVHEIVEPEVIAVEDAQDTIARERLARDKVGAFSAQIAEELLAAWTDPAAPPADLLARHGLSASAAGPFAPAQPRLLGAGTSPTFEAAITAAGGIGMLKGVYPTTGGRLVGGITAFEPPDAEMYDTMKDFILVQLLQQRREEFMERYTDDLVARAKVERIYTP